MQSFSSTDHPPPLPRHEPGPAQQQQQQRPVGDEVPAAPSMHQREPFHLNIDPQSLPPPLQTNVQHNNNSTHHSTPNTAGSMDFYSPYQQPHTPIERPGPPDPSSSMFHQHHTPQHPLPPHEQPDYGVYPPPGVNYHFDYNMPYYPPPFPPPDQQHNMPPQMPYAFPEPHIVMRPVLITPQPQLAPRRQPRRYNTSKRVKLTGGHLVLDCPIPEAYLSRVSIKDGKEFTHMRYTAITNDPSDFNSYNLRQGLMQRETELFICITMYNEDEVLLSRTLHGVMRNIFHLCQHTRSKTWGKDAWQKIVVCIIADGREKVHQSVLDMLTAIGIYQDGVAKNVVAQKPVQAHLYEYTTQVSFDPDRKFRTGEHKIPPTQLMFCLKEKNQRKINSHRWFFQALCPKIRPKVCMLFDVGTRPGPHSIYHLWKTFDIYPDVGGACGEIRAMTGPGGVLLLNPLVASQNFEYKISNILDKPLESFLGYIQVLPGAFSAYRYAALQNDMNGNGPLQKYFLGEVLHGSDADVFEANMYLAEDRILCYELVAKPNACWTLHYVSNAFGETDVPSSVPEFISQRRRWLNGSFFSGVYALFHWGKILRTDHSTGRKFLLFIELIYLSIQWLFSWFALGNFFISFYILTSAIGEVPNPPFSPQAANIVHVVLVYIYGVLLVTLFLLALGNRPQGSKGSYTMMIVFFALMMGYMIFCSVWIAYQGVVAALSDPREALLQDGSFRDIVISMAATFAVYLIASILFLDPWHMFTSFIQYLFMSASYINILNTFAFCNTHDVSWGTKDIDTVAFDLGVVEVKHENETAEVALLEQQDVGDLYVEACQRLGRKPKKVKQHRDASARQLDYYAAFRTRLVICWIITNLILVGLICTADSIGWLGSFNQKTNGYMAFILWAVVVLSCVRFIGCVLYLFTSAFSKCTRHR
ncbi:chitin synthase-domain-containing protein [Gongronella butleri]|nr:chitin synthase-domain-containing protein [Gongronella butleri]